MAVTDTEGIVSLVETFFKDRDDFSIVREISLVYEHRKIKGITHGRLSTLNRKAIRTAGKTSGFPLPSQVVSMCMLLAMLGRR